MPFRILDWPDGLLAFLMRGFDRLRIVTTPRRRPGARHRPEHYDFSEFTRPDWAGDPDRVYPDRGPLTDLVAGPAVDAGAGLIRRAVAYRSNLPLGDPADDTGRATLTARADGSARAGLVVLHGWGRRDLDREADLCRDFAAAGIDTVLMTLPYHLDRAVPGSWSGEYMVSGDVVRTLRCFQQTVAEARGLAGWMRARLPGRPVGILGISLGGILAHLAMTVEPFDFGISMISGGASAAITWESPVTHYIRQDLIAAGIDRRLLEHVWRAASPITFAAKVRTWPILMLVGRFDEVVPARHAEDLWEALGRPEIRRYPVAHYSAFFSFSRMTADIIDFVGRAAAAYGPQPRHGE